MRDQDKKEFAEMYRGMCSNYGREATVEAMQFAWGALASFSIDQVAKALTAHVMTSHHFPTVADIIERIAAAVPGMSRPGADEAWAKTPPESESYWATDEMIGAWAAVAHEMNSPRPDKTAARMAFRDTYNRLVAEAQAQGRPVRWSLVRGTRHNNLEQVIRDGARLGYIRQTDADELIRLECDGAKTTNMVPLLQGAIASKNERALEAVAALKALLAKPTPMFDLAAARAECEARDRELLARQSKPDQETAGGRL